MIRNIHKELLHELYRAPVHLHWVLANFGHRLMPGFSFGWRGRIIRRLVGFACAFGCARLIVSFVAATELARLMYLARRAPQLELPESSCIFVGFGAGSEEQMWHGFKNDSDGLAIRLDQTLPETFLSYHRPGTRELLKQIWCESGVVVPFLLNTLLESGAPNRKDSVTYAALRMAAYVLYRTWWRDLRNKSISKIVFISPDIPAYACIDAGMTPVEYHQHGFHIVSILMPPFDVLRLLTQADVDWYQQHLPKSRFEISPSPERVAQHLPRILVASIYNYPKGELPEPWSKNQDSALLQSLVDWADKENLEVIVRMHPRESDNFWKVRFPKLRIDATQDSFQEALLRIKPMFVVSWGSTCLVDATKENVVPVSIMGTNSKHLDWFVYDVSKHCLLWPDDKVILEEVVGGRLDPETVISKLNNRNSLL